MRIVKLSKNVYGFDAIDACKAYFNHVLPWQKGVFNIVGEGSHIAPNSIDNNEIILFSYDGKIICIARAEEEIIRSQKVIAIKIRDEEKKVFSKPVSTTEIENMLNALGYTKKIYGSQGWNIIDHEYEQSVVDYLMKKDWEYFYNHIS